MTKLEAIKKLIGYDHLFLTAEGVKTFTKPFGFNGSIYEATDTRSQFKGLNFGDNYKEGDKRKGQDADVIACEIADKLGVKYRDMFGRGSALRECCRAVEEHLTKV